jgi:hypothetical protein
MSTFEIENGLLGMDKYVNIRLLKLIAETEFKNEVRKCFTRNRNSQMNNRFYNKNIKRYKNGDRYFFKQETNKNPTYIHQINPFFMNVPFIVKTYLSTCSELLKLKNHNYLRTTFSVLFNNYVNAYRHLNEIYEDYYGLRRQK